MDAIRSPPCQSCLPLQQQDTRQPPLFAFSPQSGRLTGRVFSDLHLGATGSFLIFPISSHVVVSSEYFNLAVGA